jgi:hypothetical protein
LSSRVDARLARAAVAAGFVVFYASAPFGFTYWTLTEQNAWAYLSGEKSRDDYANAFSIPPLYFFYGDIDRTSRFLREHSTEADRICVRGFNPEIYILANRRYGGRFFWSNFLVQPERAYRRPAYLAEDAEAFERIKPRFVVTLSAFHEGLDSTEYYLPLGYHVAANFDHLTVLERNGV